MSFEPENELEEAMLRHNKHAMARRDFHHLLLNTELIVLGRVEGRDHMPDKMTVAPGEKIKLASMQYRGKACIPAFTTLTRLQAFLNKDAAWLSINARALFEIIRGNTLLLNPGSEWGKEFPPEEIEILLASKAIH